MATNINYQINSREFFGPLANWQSIEAGRRDDNSPFFNSADMFNHSWTVDSMPVVDFVFLEALNGQPIIIDTNKRTDRAVAIQYTTAFINSVTGSQRGLRVQGVEVNFLIKAAT